VKILPFKIPKPENEAFVYQEDHDLLFYDKLHQHEEIQISLIANGEGTLIVGDSVTDYKSDDILVMGSNLPHVFKSDVTEGKNSLMVSLFFNKKSFGDHFFDLKEFDSLQSFFNQSIYGLKLISNKNELKNLFLKLRKASNLDRFILLFEILRLIAKSNTESLSSFVNQKNYSDNEGKRMSEVFEYTMNHFNHPISLLQIAGIANMTTNAFCKYFKQRTNKTYLQFLTELRIEYACKLLDKNNDLAIAEIATISGFNTISNFNRKFKSLKKMAPLQYKLTHYN